MNRIIHGDNGLVLNSLQNETFDLIYIDPPFNTGKEQKGRSGTFNDKYPNLPRLMKPLIHRAKELLKPSGSFFLHIGTHEAHYIKVLLDDIFGRKCFMNEIIWSYDYGGRSKSKWSNKHDHIFWYVMNPNNYTFNLEESDKIPYMAPGLVGADKAARGKLPTDVWWNTIVPTQGPERTGYPTQKPMNILRRIIRVHSNEGDHVLDFFGGSGTTGEAALEANRTVTLVDNNLDAIEVMKKRLTRFDIDVEVFEDTE